MSIEVQTTQNVTIDYEPASIGHRVLAYIIDYLVMILWVIGCVGLMYIFALMGGVTIFEYNWPTIFFSSLMIFPILFYDLIFEAWNRGQSPGKMVLKIRVINTDGTTPSFGSYMLRWLFRLVDFSLFNGIVAIVSIAATKNSQRLGDLLAGTTVISLKLDAKSQLQIPSLDFREDYKVTYIDVLDRLSDRDLQTIRSIMNDSKMAGNDYFTSKLSQRIKEITGYQSSEPDYVFLRKIVSDYNYLALQDA
ncbi:RDD family protein [Dysgonomonas sp. 25]|uniref:RDD family protein n=1 Tax=Dysgonomonas sp. 25 TaxID=2302933 RepID=UPI0013D2A34E|nr:RDD family protein [Dysgonomonas sp. 25]NDV67617.1 RDD family protein [Dysgonomonas sp. 25]